SHPGPVEGPGVASATANPLYRSTFVGREQELKQLQAAFDAALSGNGGLTTVVGEPGIGKTALCEQLATYAALRGGRALVVGTYRDVEVDRTHPLSATLAELRRPSSLPRVLLRGLTVDEVHRMYEAIRGQSVAWAQAELVHRQTEGHPLFVQEVLRYLVEEGLVVREGGRYQVKPEAAQNEAVLPDGLRDVVGRRLSRLSDKTNQVLSVAAVIGREFRLDVLQNLLA